MVSGETYFGVQLLNILMLIEGNMYILFL